MSDVTGIADILHTLNLVRDTLCLSIAKRNHADELLILADIVCLRNLAVRESYTTGVES